MEDNGFGQCTSGNIRSRAIMQRAFGEPMTDEERGHQQEDCHRAAWQADFDDRHLALHDSRSPARR